MLLISLKEIHSFKFSKSILEKLCRIIEPMYSEMAYAYNNGITSTNHNTSSSLENLRYRGLKHVSIYFYSGIKRVRVEVSVKGIYSYATIAGTDPAWVRGTSEHIFEIFDEDRLGINSFIHSRKVWLPNVVFVIFLPILFYYLLPKSTLSLVFVSTIIPSIIIWGYWFFEWLYPNVETQEIIQVRLRKLLTVIGFIAALITILGVFIRF
jgi:hypothetical protein